MFQRKYQPTAFGELVFESGETRELLRQYASGQTSGNLLLHGPFGTGKTSAAKIIAESGVQANSFGVDEFNGADFESADFTKMMNGLIFQRHSGVEFAYVIMNELDALSKNLQQQLRAKMDACIEGTGFIFTTNSLHNVIPSIQSRCEVVELPSLTAASVFSRTQSILTAEGVNLKNSELESVLSKCGGDMREINRALEKIALLSQQKKAAALHPNK